MGLRARSWIRFAALPRSATGCGPSSAATVGIPAPTWLAAGILIPFAFLGGLAGRPIGDRLGAEAFAMLALVLLAVAGAYTLGAAAVAFAAA
jgi:cation transport ATPase